jgi:hypothetical protein
LSANKKDLDVNILGQVSNKLVARQAQARDLGPVEFVETIIDAFDMELFTSQKVLLKSIYGFELNPDEQELMDGWVQENKTNWKDPEFLLADVNMQRKLENKKPRERFRFQNITMQAGMRCLTGDTLVFLEGRGYTRLDELLPSSPGPDVETALFGRIQTKFGMQPLVRGLSRGPQRVIKVRTEKGYELAGSEEHPLQVLRADGTLEWKEMRKLAQGDRLLIDRQPVSFCPNAPVPHFEGLAPNASVLGRLLGQLSTASSVNPGVEKALYSMDTPHALWQQWQQAAGLPSFQLWVWQLLDGLQHEGIPAVIRSGSRELVQAFLQGVFDAGAKLNKGLVIKRLGDRLSRELQVLLVGFGIIAERRQQALTQPEKIPDWELYLDHANTHVFEQVIGFSQAHKIYELREWLARQQKHSLFYGTLALQPDADPRPTFTEQVPDPIVAIWESVEPVYDVLVPRYSQYIANGLVSHNSSKSSTVALAVVYEFFKHITSPHPQKDLGVPKASPIYLTVIASSERQVKGTIFWYVKEYITKSSFFRTMIDAGEIIVRDLDIEFPDKGVIIACGHSKATSIVGRTAVLVAFDELAMFSADEGHTSNAQEVYSRVGKSTATYKDHAKRIALSSVKCEGDFMEALVRDDWDRQNAGCLVFDLTTFDMNPLLSKDDAGILSDYVKDPVAAARDYENVRPGAAGSFFIPSVVDMAAVIDPQAIIAHQAMPIFRQRGEAAGFENQITAHNEDVREMSGLQVVIVPADNSIESFGHCDIGLKKDSFGFAVGHAEWSEEGIVTIIDAVLEWQPRHLGKNRWAPVDLVNAEDILLEIAKKRKMLNLTYDQWNSASSIQRLFRENVITKETTFTAPFQRKIYDSLRSRANLGLVKIPANAVLIEELKNIELRHGETIAHPKNKDSSLAGRGKISKDLADAVAAVNWAIVQRYGIEFNPQSKLMGTPAPGLNGAGVYTANRLRAQQNINWNFFNRRSF